jgi:hypothetical protein
MANGICLEFEYWSFPGAWGLGFGAYTSELLAPTL